MRQFHFYRPGGRAAAQGWLVDPSNHSLHSGSNYAQGENRYSNCGIEPLTATQDTRDLVDAAMTILNRIYRPGIAYAKAGVMLSAMTDGTEQLSLFDTRPAGRQSGTDESYGPVQ